MAEYYVRIFVATEAHEQNALYVMANALTASDAVRVVRELTKFEIVSEQEAKAALPSEISEWNIDSIRKFIQKHPRNSICDVWKDMLSDIDAGETVELDEFDEVAEEDYAYGKLSAKSATEITNFFPGVFSWE